MVNSQEFIEGAIAEIKREVGNHRAIIALSGGVDSSVCAALAYQALGANLYPVYVDTGLMRKGETENIKQAFRHMPLTIIDAKARFINALDSIVDPEEKRKITGETFIRIFEEVARQKQVEYWYKVRSIQTLSNLRDRSSRTTTSVASPRRLRSTGSLSPSSTCTRMKSAKSRGPLSCHLSSVSACRFPDPGSRCGLLAR